jgi:hypothetical protein
MKAILSIEREIASFPNENGCTEYRQIGIYKVTRADGSVEITDEAGARRAIDELEPKPILRP